MRANTPVKLIFLSAVGLQLSGCAATSVISQIAAGAPVLPKMTHANFSDRKSCTHVSARSFTPGILPGPTFQKQENTADMGCLDNKHVVILLSSKDEVLRSRGMNRYMELSEADKKIVVEDLAVAGLKIEDIEKNTNYLLKQEQRNNCATAYYNAPGNPNAPYDFDCSGKAPTSPTP